jgi:integrase
MSKGSNPTDPIRDRRHIRAIKSTLKAEKKAVQYLLFTLGINSGLRVGDLLKLHVDDLWKSDGVPRKEFSRRAQKNKALAITQINDAILEAMRFSESSIPTYDLDAPLFDVSRQMVGRWVKQWCHDVGIDRGNYSAHTLRKTFAYQLWTEQGRSFEALVVVSKALGHQSTGTTLDYLGIRREQIAKWQKTLNL